MKMKKIIALLLAGSMMAAVLAGCGNKEVDKKLETGKNTEAAGVNAEVELPDVELWYTITKRTVGNEKDGPLYKHYKDTIGVGIVQPYVEWNGGQTYLEQLNLRISAGEIPDMFHPVMGVEAELIANDALLDLTELLPEKAPHLWEAIPEEVWDRIRLYDPSGEGRIFVVPCVVTVPRMAAMIRQDWLDALGLDMPTTQEDFVNVLRAFKEKDPNGNGIQDEIPTGGRAEARWMDHIFAMYGVAMYEGFPDWDIYDGEFTYSAVTQNMKDALQFASELYAEGLLDPETLLNDKAGWEGKVNAGKVGVFYHWVPASYGYEQKMYEGAGIAGEWVYMPTISAPGYEGYYTYKQLGANFLVCANTEDEAKIESMMRVLDAMADPDKYDAMTYGPEEYSWNYDEAGNKVIIEEPDMEMPFELPSTVFYSMENVLADLETLLKQQTDEIGKARIERSIANTKATADESMSKAIAGDGLPSTIYNGYPDIQSRVLYVEYASKIITGEYSIDKFDEFVERWYATGGTEVTEVAREWYGGIAK